MKRILWVFIVMFFYAGKGSSQSPGDTLHPVISADVEWSSQYPEPSKKSKRKVRTAGDLLNVISGAGRSEEWVLNKPVALMADDPQHFWVADQGNGLLFTFQKNKWVTPRAFLKGKFRAESLVGICQLPGKGILFSDSRLNKLFLLNEDQAVVTPFAAGDSLMQPTGISVSPVSHEVWVTETAAHRIQVYDQEGNRVKTIGTRGNGPGEFNYPIAVCFNRQGQAYVVDALNYRIQVFDQSGKWMRSFGSAGNASGYFALPKGVATDSYGNVYVTDALFHNVQIFSPAGTFLYHFGTQGREKGQFWIPSGIFIDKLDNIYVADSYNSRIQVFKLVNIKKNE